MSARPASVHPCRRCHGPLAEILSDVAGRDFGCYRCRAVDACNARPPAEVVEVYRYTRRERRREARWRTRNRWRARRVPKTVERTQPRPDRVVVMRADVLRRIGSVTRELPDGWAIGVLVRETWAGPFAFYRDAPPEKRWTGDKFSAWSTIETVRFKSFGGMVWGEADETAPERLVTWALERLWWERIHDPTRAFLKSLEPSIAPELFRGGRP